MTSGFGLVRSTWQRQIQGPYFRWCILVDDVFVDLHFPLGEADPVSLERVVHLLRDAEKVRRALDHPPTGLDAQAVHQKGLRGEDLRHAAAVIRGIYVCDVDVPERPRLPDDTLDRFRSDVRLEIFDLDDLFRNPHGSPPRLSSAADTFPHLPA
jgi:hypothetical protein